MANYKSLKQKIEKLREIPPDCTYADETAADKKVRQKNHEENYNSNSCISVVLSLYANIMHCR